MLILVGVLFGAIFGFKFFKAKMVKKYLSSLKPVATVSAMKVESSLWQPKLRAVASLRAKVGVNVTTELAGMVQSIYFTPGTTVEKGTVLVQLNAGTELGQLHSLEAQVELAKITYARDKAQFAVKAVSKQTVDTDEWNLNNLKAQVEEQKATVEKKTIRAPFTGQLGINQVNPGQYLNVGDTVVNLQALDPLYVDFFLPQQAISQLKLGQLVGINTDAYPKKNFEGKITTIQPAVDVATRNIQVEATIPNADHLLKPGMFARVEVDTESPETFITVPQTAVSFNPYGDIVYLVVDSSKKDDKGEPILIAQQVFVQVGETRGDQIAIIKGLKAGDTVVTSGQLKLKNGSQITINNTVEPSNAANPIIKEK